MRTAWIAPLALAVLLLAGCASGPNRPEWSRPAGQAVDSTELHRDMYECQRENTYYQQPAAFGPLGGPLGPGPKLDKDRYRLCMRARGWVHEDD